VVSPASILRISMECNLTTDAAWPKDNVIRISPQCFYPPAFFRLPVVVSTNRLDSVPLSESKALIRPSSLPAQIAHYSSGITASPAFGTGAPELALLSARLRYNELHQARYNGTGRETLATFIQHPKTRNGSNARRGRFVYLRLGNHY
jgi:hypothetical protein